MSRESVLPVFSAKINGFHVKLKGSFKELIMASL